MTPLELIKKEEGVRKYAYLDSLGVWTIGCGRNIESSEANGLLRKHGINPDVIWAAIEETKKAGGGRKPGEHTKELLNDVQIDALLKEDVDLATSDVRQLMPKFDTMPDNAKAVLVSMRFQLGPARLRGFKNTLKAFQENRWKDAANGMRASLAYNQTPQRWERAAKLLEAI